MSRFSFIFIGLLAFQGMPLNVLADVTCETDYYGRSSTTKCKQRRGLFSSDIVQKEIELQQRALKGFRQSVGNLTGADTRTTNHKRQDYYLQQQQEIARQNKQTKENELAYQRRLRQLEEDDLAHQRRLRKLEYEKALLELELLKIQQKETEADTHGYRDDTSGDSKNDTKKYTKIKNDVTENHHTSHIKCWRLDGYEVIHKISKGATCGFGWTEVFRGL